ncbi:ABC transporter permease [Spirulina sp. CS-785/01]|nr:ABC transporter permease [Spirulina sp. CS-785/01]
MSQQSLWQNPVRSGLTIFGVFMGVAAVNATLQVGVISRGLIQRQIEQQEAPQIFTRIRYSQPRIPEAEVEQLAEQLGNVEALDKYNSWAWGEAQFGSQTTSVGAIAVSEQSLQASGREMLQGRFFYPEDYQQFRQVTVIDQLMAEELFGEQTPLGQRILFNNSVYEVIGVMEAKPVWRDGNAWKQMLVPLSLHYAQVGQKEIRHFRVRPNALEQITQQEEQLKGLLNQRYTSDQYWLGSNAEEILRQQDVLKMTEKGLLAVGGIALFIAGIGVANITLAATLERTAEIGLKRALGATKRDILSQFILEAVFISLIGGGIAIVTVEGCTQIISQQFDLPYQFAPRTAFVSLVAAIVVGVGASYFPARQASNIEPIEALKS